MLERFIKAQENEYNEALSQMKKGRKTSHWMWYVFPQIKGLGDSCNAKHYAIQDIKEAIEYYQHPILGKRLKEITQVILELPSSDARVLMGSSIDALKLRSSMTLFLEATNDPLFKQVLDKYFDGKKDRKTIEILYK